MRNLAVAFGIVAAAAGPARGAAAGDLSPTRATELTQMLRRDCGSCHGLTLRGGLGPPLVPEALAGKDADFLTAVVLDGLPGTAMPPWRPLLGEGEAAWMIRELQRGLP